MRDHTNYYNVVDHIDGDVKILAVGQKLHGVIQTAFADHVKSQRLYDSSIRAAQRFRFSKQKYKGNLRQSRV